MILHLPMEARLGGPVQNRWCYATERMHKTLRAKCKNNGELKHQRLRHSLSRKRQTSWQHTMLPLITVCIIQSLGTILASPSDMNPSWNSLKKGASHLVGLCRQRRWPSRNGASLHCISWPTWQKCGRTSSKCSVHINCSATSWRVVCLTSLNYLIQSIRRAILEWSGDQKRLHRRD